MSQSKYRAMWLVAMFDLPVTTRKARKAYAHFRKTLLERGFTMLQNSVYARYCTSEEASDVRRAHVRRCLPDDGQVRLMAITDIQFGKMGVFYGKKCVPAEPAPSQLTFF